MVSPGHSMHALLLTEVRAHFVSLFLIELPSSVRLMLWVTFAKEITNLLTRA